MVRTTIDRLEVKTLEQRFRFELETGFELAPRIAQGILDVAKGIFSLDGASVSQSTRQRLGQIRQVIASAEAPHGRPLCQTDMVDVIWTLDAGEEDLQVLKKYGRVALRQARLLRLVDRTDRRDRSLFTIGRQTLNRLLKLDEPIIVSFFPCSLNLV